MDQAKPASEETQPNPTKDLDRLQGELREAESRFNATFEQSAVGLTHVDSEGRFLRVNQRYCDLVGYRPEELLAGNVETVTHPSDLAADRQARRDLLEGKTRKVVREKQFLRKDKSTAWAHITITLIRDSEGAPRYFLTVAQDITQQKKAEQHLDRFARILENSADFVAIVDADGKVQYLNRAGKHMMGTPEDGTPPHSSFLDYMPKRLRDFVQLTALTMAAEEGLWQGEGALEAIDGAEIPVWQTLVAHKSRNGDVEFYSVSCRSIADRKEAQKELERNKQVADMAVNVFPGVFFLFTQPGQMRWWNRSFTNVTGYSSPEIAGMQPSDFIHGDTRQAFQQAVDEALAHGQSTAEVAFLRRDADPSLYDLALRRVTFEEKPCVGIAGIDASIRRRAEKEQEHLFNLSVDMLGVVKLDGSFQKVNPAWTQTLGWSETELLRSPGTSFVHPADREEMNRALRIMQNREGLHSFEVRFRTKDGKYRWLAWNVLSLPEEGRFFAVARDVTHRKEVEEEVRSDTLHDALTGLPRRPLLIDRLTHALELRRRDREYHFAVMVVDLDGFSAVNEKHGAHVGDQLLVEVSRRIKNCLRPGDTVARLGGDEFAILLESHLDVDAAREVGRRVLNALVAPYQVAGREVELTVSLGVVHSRAGSRSPQELLRDADTAMYQARRLGSNQCVVFNESMQDAVLNKVTLEGDLKRAVRRQEFVLRYQPVVHLPDYRITGFEVLVRWSHPEKGLVPPSQFLSLAEEMRIMPNLGEWILKESCRQVAEWHKDFHRDLVLFVNLSAQQFGDSELEKKVSRALEDSGLDPSSLYLELTERALMDQEPATRDIVSRLRGLGVKFCVDDFGMGISSVTYLNRLELNALRIDRGYVAHMKDSSKNQDLVRAIGSLARGLHLDLIAEGVENDEQLALLESMGFEFAQGLKFGQPLDPDSAVDFLVSGKIS